MAIKRTYDDPPPGRLTSSEPPPRVFVSSAIELLRDERDALVAVIRELGLDPFVYERKPASSQRVEDSYLDYVHRSERVIWIVTAQTSRRLRRRFARPNVAACRFCRS